MAKLKKQVKPIPKLAVTKISPKIIKSKSKLKKENEVKLPPLPNKTKLKKEDKAKPPPITSPSVGSLLKNPIANKCKLDRSVVESGVKAMFQLYEKERQSKKELFDEHDSVMLQINCVKVPAGENMTIHVSLMYPLVDKDSEICLIVADDKTGDIKEHERTVERYEELLRKNGIENIKTIMTYHEMRTEYGQYEMQKRLRQLYDVFLVDGKISGYVNKKLRHQFMKRRKMPISIKLEGPNLKERIEKALMKVDLHIHGKGDSYIAQVGHTGMEERQIVENVFAFYETLDGEFPGGTENLRSLHLKTTRGKSVPVYLTLKNKSEVKVPIIKSKKPKAAKVYEDELSTLDNAKVKVFPSGEVKVTELEGEQENKVTNKKKGKTTKGKEVEKVKVVKEEKIGKVNVKKEEKIGKVKVTKEGKVKVTKEGKVEKLKVKKEKVKIENEESEDEEESDVEDAIKMFNKEAEDSEVSDEDEEVSDEDESDEAADEESDIEDAIINKKIEDNEEESDDEDEEESDDEDEEESDDEDEETTPIFNKKTEDNESSDEEESDEEKSDDLDEEEVKYLQKLAKRAQLQNPKNLNGKELPKAKHNKNINGKQSQNKNVFNGKASNTKQEAKQSNKQQKGGGKPLAVGQKGNKRKLNNEAKNVFQNKKVKGK